jgi:hypothetical protein
MDDPHAQSWETIPRRIAQSCWRPSPSTTSLAAVQLEADAKIAGAGAGRAAPITAEIGADAGARTELSTSLQSTILFVNFSPLRYPTLAIVSSSLHILLVAFASFVLCARFCSPLQHHCLPFERFA